MEKRPSSSLEIGFLIVNFMKALRLWRIECIAQA